MVSSSKCDGKLIPLGEGKVGCVIGKWIAAAGYFVEDDSLG